MEKRKIVLIVVNLLFSILLSGQNVLQGVVLNKTNFKPVAGVQIVCEKTQLGTTSDSSGIFTLQIPPQCTRLEVYALGFKRKEVSLTHGRKQPKPLKIELVPLSYSLNQITISAAMVQNEGEPVAINNISARTIRNELSDQPLPLIFNSDPSVFSVRNGGGSGDANLSLRGFQQENVAILLNGIPINGEENGLMYWSNWLGLTDVLTKVQIQKGPGYANIASNAVGGSINLVTDNAVTQKGGSATLQTTSYGNTKIGCAYNSGITEKGWLFSAAFSAFVGPGYIEATPIRGMAYFVTANKTINKRNSLSLTLLGAPQYHEQRTLKLTEEEVMSYGYDFNKDWGWYRGKRRNASANFYHKPFFTVDHNVTLNSNAKLTNTFYFSYGNGGGKWSESFRYAPSIFQYRDENQQIDWETIIHNNQNNNETYVLENGDTVTGFSKNVQTDFLASHVETGFLSSLEYQLTGNLTLKTGVHYRFFKSFLREEISDLLGGNFFIEDYSWSLAGVSGRNQLMYPGDIIKVNNHSVINLVNGYARLNYTSEMLHWFFSLKGSNNFYRRIDDYNYIENRSSQTVSKPGFDVRSGIGLSSRNRKHLFFVNGAYISKAPYFKYVFGNFTNTPVPNIRNERFITFEAGYQLKTTLVQLNLNGYYTRWNNVSMLTNEYVQLENNQLSRAVINGLNSIHKGIEAAIHYTVPDFVNLSAFIALADYRWSNDATAKLVNNGNVITDTVNVYLKGVHVGGTAQQKTGLTVDFMVFQKLNLKLEGLYFDKLYANFNPVNRNVQGDYSDAYRFPSYAIVNGYLKVPFMLGHYHAFVAFSGFNLLNNRYIESGEDGNNHNLDSFRGFWSFGRNCNLMFKIFF